MATTRALQNKGGPLSYIGAMRELVCNGQLWTRAALRQLCSRKVYQREYSLAKTQEMAAVTQYILTSAQSSRDRQIGLSVAAKKILT